MINKQKLWFLTLFSLILVLSVYYITMPSELLTTAKTSDKNAVTEKKTSKTKVKAKVSSTDSLTALQVELDEERQALAAEYNEVLTNKDTSTEEKNNAYNGLKEIDGLIDCGTNEELFLAIAALRDDTDKNQWFTDGDKWILCPEIKFSTYWAYNDVYINTDTIHKATVNELIEHFNKS